MHVKLDLDVYYGFLIGFLFSFCMYGSEFMFCCSWIIEFYATFLCFWYGIYVLCDYVNLVEV